MIKEALVKAFGFVKGIASKAVSVVAGVSMMTVAKFAVAAGLTIGTAILVIKFFKDKFKMLTSNNVSKTPIEKNLDRNFADYRKRRTLHREMEEVSETLWDDTPRRGEGYGWMDEFEDEIMDDAKNSKKKSKKSSNKEFENFVEFVKNGSKLNSKSKNSKKKSKKKLEKESLGRIWDNAKVHRYVY